MIRWHDFDGNPVATLFPVAQEIAPLFAGLHLEHAAAFRVHYAFERYVPGGLWTVDLWSGAIPTAAQAWLWLNLHSETFRPLEFPDAPVIGASAVGLSCGWNRRLARGLVHILTNANRDFTCSTALDGEIRFSVGAKKADPAFRVRADIPLPEGY